jgi:uncharacterized protein YbaR (Trm112 family)
MTLEINKKTDFEELCCCIDCNSNLVEEENYLICIRCSKKFIIKDNIAVLLD